VATSRALLGVHWLTDIVAGLIVGWTWFTLVAIIFGGRLQRLGEPAERVPVEPVENESPPGEGNADRVRAGGHAATR
jgi:undecaprenyl-diphosphatase